jgi:hypothetical protein
MHKFREKVEKGRKLQKMAEQEGWQLVLGFFQSTQKNCYENFLNSKSDEGSEALKMEARTIQKILTMVNNGISEGKWCEEQLEKHQNYIPKERKQK